MRLGRLRGGPGVGPSPRHLTEFFGSLDKEAMANTVLPAETKRTAVPSPELVGLDPADVDLSAVEKTIHACRDYLLVS